MPKQANLKVSRAEFGKTYRAEIQQRKFVEHPEYYTLSEERFWQGFRRIQAMTLPRDPKVLDIGGGITGALLAKLLGFNVTVADVTDAARLDVEDMGLEFVKLDLFNDTEPAIRGMDMVILQEVIEHIPLPPYIVLEKIKAMLDPGGLLFMTTPNGHRLRNILYLLAGREILDIYRYPDSAGEPLGHQHEYTLKQLLWQCERADMDVVKADHYQDGWQGSSTAARLAWKLMKPAGIVPRLRNSIVMTLQKSA